MTVRRRRLVAGIASAVTAAGALLGGVIVGSASAAVTPGWQPDANAIGTLGFYDASGNQITSGSINDDPMAAYYAASGGAIASGDFKSYVSFSTPVQGANSATWAGTQIVTSSQAFPAAGLPGSLAGSTHAVVHSLHGDGSFQFNQINNFPNTSTVAGYQNLYEVRINTIGGPNGASVTWYVADILVSGTTWSQVYPVVSTPTPTSTALGVTPASPQAQGTTLTLKATVSPTAAAGTVQFFDGATSLGSSAVAAGVAQITNSTLAAGPHSLTAKFVPTDPTAFATSTSSATPFTITSAAVPTATAIAAVPLSPVVSGTSVTFTATVTPAAAGTVQFFDGASPLGSPATVSGGTASTTTSGLPVATHPIKATFTPSNPTAFLGSTSPALSYTVTSVPATPTTTTLGAAPASPQLLGSTVTLTATVAPSSAAGSVTFFDGATAIPGPVPVSGGKAVKAVSSLTVGTHSLTATFTPTDPTAFTPSASPAVSYTINPLPATPTTTALAVTPAGPVTAGTPVTLKATVSPAAAAGSVTFFDGTTAMPGPVTVSGGIASATVSTLSVATHSLTAQFTPTDPSAFGASTSAAVSLQVNNPPPGTTTTSLAVSPPGPVVSGTPVTLTASVAPTAATGTVQFMDGASALGTPVTTVAGTASLPTSALTVGSHSLTAVFTSNTVSFTGSSSAPVTLMVKAPPTTTTTALAVTPASPQLHGTSLTLTATVTPSVAVGSVQFLDGTTVLGTASVSGGTASTTNATMATGSHSLTAKFVPTDATAFTAATSAAVPFSITAAPATPTTTTLAVTPAGPVGQYAPVTMTATVSPAAAPGMVQLLDGTFVLATVNVSGGTASFTTKALGVGSHSLTARFVPTNSADFTPSTSPASSLVVQSSSTTPPPVTVSVKGSTGHTVAAGATLKPGTHLTLTGGGFTAGEHVVVTVHSTTVTLATFMADGFGNVSGAVTLPASLSAGSHTLTLNGVTSAATVSFGFRVAASSTGGGTTGGGTTGGGTSGGTSGGSTSGNLAATGTDLVTPGLLALTLLAAGTMLVLAARRGRTRYGSQTA